MRLIDADALNEALEGEELYVSDAIIIAGHIDAAPTVCCEECELEPVCLGSEVGDVIACKRFERRQP